jgi:hypothetical protein
MCHLTHKDVAIAAYFLWLKDCANRPKIAQGQDFYWFEAERDLIHECAATGDHATLTARLAAAHTRATDE